LGKQANQTDWRRENLEGKIIGLFLIALIGGLGGGLGLTYIIYQPQIQNLQNTITDIKNMTWHQVYSSTASGDVVSGDFQLSGSSVRVMWIAEGNNPSAWVSFELDFSNGTGFGIWMSSGLRMANNAVLELHESGNYYLNATAYLTNYYVSVWDYY
jgi:hypothetical protein